MYISLYNPSQNGVIERKNRYVLETRLTMMVRAGLHLQYWSTIS